MVVWLVACAKWNNNLMNKQHRDTPSFRPITKKEIAKYGIGRSTMRDICMEAGVDTRRILLPKEVAKVVNYYGSFNKAS